MAVWLKIDVRQSSGFLQQKYEVDKSLHMTKHKHEGHVVVATDVSTTMDNNSSAEQDKEYVFNIDSIWQMFPLPRTIDHCSMVELDT
jgi:hypothetical protein